MPEEQAAGHPRFGVNQKQMAWQPEHHRLFRCMMASSPLLCLMAILACIAVTAGRCGFAQDVVNREPALKAAFLVKFAKYVTWPPMAFADEKAPLVIGTLGQSDVAAPLAEISKRRLLVQNRPVTVRLATRPAELAGSHIVYLPATLTHEQRSEALRLLQGRHVLAVGDDPAFLSEGGLLRFTIDNNRLGGVVSLTAFHREQLQASSELLTIFKPAD